MENWSKKSSPIFWSNKKNLLKKKKNPPSSSFFFFFVGGGGEFCELIQQLIKPLLYFFSQIFIRYINCFFLTIVHLKPNAFLFFSFFVFSIFQSSLNKIQKIKIKIYFDTNFILRLLCVHCCVHVVYSFNKILILIK